MGRNLSSDGSRFFFETPDALVAADTNGDGGCPPWGSLEQQSSSFACQDVYEWEAPGTGSCKESSPAYSPLNEGCIYLISTGKSKEATFFADADPEGDNVFIFTFEQLVPQDKDGLIDAYDARIGGGLAAQHATAGEPCDGEGCKPQPLPPPATQSPGSGNYSGPADPTPSRKAKKKKKKRKHAKHKKRKHAKHKHRAAKRNGGAGR